MSYQARIITGCTLWIAGLLAFIQPVHAQSNTWVRKNDVAYNGQDGPEKRSSLAFAIGNLGYMLASDGVLWAYDPQADTWSSRAAVPGLATGGWAALSVAGRGYLFQTTGTMQTWVYDPVLNSWSNAANFPGALRYSPAGFVVGGKAYVGIGNDQHDLWEYDPDQDLWTPKADYPINGLQTAKGFAIGAKGYFTGGCSACGEMPTLTGSTYEYDPLANTWTQKASGPNAGTGRVAFVIGNKAYVGLGATIYSEGSNLMNAFDPVLNTWTSAGSFGYSVGRQGAFAFAIGDKGYIGGGGKSGGYHQASYNDFHEFDPVTLTYTPRSFLGGTAVPRSCAFGWGTKGTFMRGGAIGQYSWSQGEVWDYAPGSDTWTRRAVQAANPVGASSFIVQGKGYKAGGAVTGSAGGTVTAYQPDADAWTYRASVPLSRYGAIAFSHGGYGYVGLGIGNSNVYRNDLRRYDPASNTWTEMAVFPGVARGDAIAFRLGDRIYVGTGYGGTYLRDMWMYDPLQNTWTQRADFGGSARRGAVAFTLGGKGYVATGNDGTWRNDLWEYDPIQDSWTQRADFGGLPRAYAFAFVSGPSAYVGGGSTGTNIHASDMWEYRTVTTVDAVQVSPKVFLEGPYNSGTGLMSDALRTAGLVPLTEPYTALGYEHAMSGGETTTPAVLAVAGNDAIIDWVMVELRHSAQPSLVVASACALVQRDGDVVATDGLSPVRLYVGAGSYHVAIRHRNHLGAMTASAIALTSSAVTVNLTSSGTATYGTNARKTVGTMQVLWTGDASGDNNVRYTGSGNDRDPILVKVGGTTPTSTVAGYFPEDVNMDGLVKYTGGSNDRDPILVNVGSTTPNNTRLQQLP